MNIQPGNSSGRKRTSSSRQSQQQGGALGGLLVKIIQMGIVILVAGAFFHTYIRFDQDINVATAEISRIDSRMRDLDLQIQVLDNRYEECCTLDFIERQIARFNLPLVELRQDQQVFIRLYSSEQLAALSSRFHRHTAGNHRNGNW